MRRFTLQIFVNLLNSFLPNAPFLCPLKISGNRQGAEKGCIGTKWVNQSEYEKKIIAQRYSSAQFSGKRRLLCSTENLNIIFQSIYWWTGWYQLYSSDMSSCQKENCFVKWKIPSPEHLRQKIGWNKRAWYFFLRKTYCIIYITFLSSNTNDIVKETVMVPNLNL